MAITAEDLDKLKAALASGERVIRTRDRQIEYRSIEELKQAIELAEQALVTENITPRVLRGLAYHRSGL